MTVGPGGRTAIILRFPFYWIACPPGAEETMKQMTNWRTVKMSQANRDALLDPMVWIPFGVLLLSFAALILWLAQGG